MKRSLLNRHDGTSEGTLAPSTPRGVSPLADARRRLSRLGPLQSHARVRVRCRRISHDGVVLAALRRYHENVGSYVPADPLPAHTWQV